MSFQKAILFASTLTLSTLPSLGDIIAGVEFGDDRDEVEKKLTESPLADAKINNGLFGRSGLNGSFKTTKKLANLQYAIYYNWDDNDKLKHLNLHSSSMHGKAYDGELKSSWEYLVNFLSSMHGKATNAVDYPAKDQLVIDTTYFTHEWKTETGFLYMGPGLKKDGYTIVMSFTKTSLPVFQSE